MGSVVKFHVSGDSRLIRELVKRSARYHSNSVDIELDIDYDDPEYEVLTCERVEPEDLFNSEFAGEMYYWDGEEHHPWAGAPEHMHDEMIDGIKEGLNGQLVLLQVNLPHENGPGSTALSMLVDEFLGYVEVREIWHDQDRSEPDTRGLIKTDAAADD